MSGYLFIKRNEDICQDILLMNFVISSVKCCPWKNWFFKLKKDHSISHIETVQGMISVAGVWKWLAETRMFILKKNGSFSVRLTFNQTSVCQNFSELLQQVLTIRLEYLVDLVT